MADDRTARRHVGLAAAHQQCGLARLRGAGVAVLAVALAGLLVSCAGNGGWTSPSTRPPNTSGSTGSSGTTTSTNPAATLTVSVYLLRDGLLGVGHRSIPKTTAVARASLEELLAGPTDTERAAGLSSAVQAGTKVRSLNLSGTTITVDLTREFETGGGSTSTIGRLAQVTFTLTQFTTVKSVVFKVEGKTVTTFGSEGLVLDGAQTRTDFDAALPFILVETPTPGEVVTSPLRVAGLNNTFESTVRFRLRAADGTVVADTFTTGTGAGMGSWGPFEGRLAIPGAATGVVRLEVFEDSAETGQPIHLVSIPLQAGS